MTHALCAVKVHGDSIRPQSKNRPKIYAAVGNRDEMRFTITHEKDTSSAVKLRLETMAVKSDVWDKFDRRMKAKADAAANDAAGAAGEGPDMFEASGVAAE